MYLLRNPGRDWAAWQVLIAFQLCNWMCCAIVCFGNAYLPVINKLAFVFSVAGLLVSVIVLAVLPKTHASNADVWVKYSNNTGGWSDGICFLMGLLNAAFAVGTPDCISHLAEEGNGLVLGGDGMPADSVLVVPKPEVKVPQGIMLQMLTAFVCAFVYLIALMYSMSDLNAVLSSKITYFPTAEIYLQATGSSAGTVGLIAILFIATFPTLIGTFVTASRMWWSLARDNATPFSAFFAKVHPKFHSPIFATCAMSGMVTVLGCVYVGSTTAFQALISSYIVLSTLSYAGAILPHVLTGRKSIVPGPFYMGRRLGMAVNVVALAYIAVTVVFFCFPFVLPVKPRNMNYTSVITVGLMLLVTFWWFVKGRREYAGPRYDAQAASTLQGVHQDSPSDKKTAAVEELKMR